MTGLVAIAFLAAGCAAGGGDPSRPPEGQVATAIPTSAPVVGTGEITFGHDYDPDTLSIIRGSGRFRTNEPEIAWRADFSEAAHAASVELLIVGVSNQGVEWIIERLAVAIDDPDSNLLANKADLATLIKHRAGTYVLRYVREGTVLAEGRFKLVK